MTGISAQVDVTATSGTENATYSTVKSAFDAINSGIHQGIINITITGNTTEAATAVLSRSTGNSNYTSVVIKPASGISPSITDETFAGPVIRILGSNVTIDGSNNGSDSKDLSIINNFATGSQVIGMGSSDSANPLTNVTIKNTNIINGIKTTGYGIILSNTAGGTTGGYFNNIKIENNSIQKSYYGIYLLAASALGNGSGTVISKNDLYTSGANSNRFVGIYLGGTDGITISENKIGNFENTSAESKRGMWLAVSTMNTLVTDNIIDNIGYQGIAAGSATGIQVYTNAGAASTASSNKVVKNKITNLYTSGINSSAVGISLGGSTVGTLISQNVINNLVNTQANITGYGAVGIILSPTVTASATQVSNNFISKVSSFADNSTSRNYTGGILINGYGGSGYYLYHNTVYLTETQSNETQKGIPIALNIQNVTAAGAIDLRNNILITNLSNPDVATYSMSTVPSNSIFSNIDNNIYYSSGANLGQTPGGPAAYTDLSGMISILGGNANSLNALPKFVSETDLHISQDSENSAINNKGVYLSAVTIDIDGEERDTSIPDIGADEFNILTLATGNDVKEKSKIQVHPNPVKDILNIISDKKIDAVSVYNSTGQLVKEISGSQTIDLSKLSSGIYFVKTLVEGKIKVSKIIKE